MKMEGTLRGDGEEWKGFVPASAEVIPVIASYKSSGLKMWIIDSGAGQTHFAANDGWAITPL